jgi:hypothetical protein
MQRLHRNLGVICLTLLVACTTPAVEPTVLTNNDVAETSSVDNASNAATTRPNNTAVPIPSPTPEPIIVDLDAIPEVDTSQHTVPIEDVFFDTFRPVNRAVPLSEADPDLIRSLIDAIPPLYNPQFETAAEADRWLREGDFVLAYADGDEAYAYPINILNYHEIVSHTVNGRAIMATYCPLCRSGVVYDRTVQGESLVFGNTSALYESDMVMLDHKTGSYWVQVSGEAVVGPLSGERLTPLPSQMTTWGQWKTQYPHTLSLSPNTGYPRNYNRNPFFGYREQLNATGQFAFPVSDAVNDPRLQPGAVVLGVQIGDITRAYAIEQIGDGVINDTVAETAVVIFSAAEGPTGAAYSPLVDGRRLTFIWVDGTIQDEETGSMWNFSGQAIDGDLEGTQLDAFPVRSTLWFALIAAFPDLELYK